MDSVNPDPKNIPDDELQLQNYQDDLDTSSRFHDPLLDEETDDPTELLGVDRKEFKNELDQYAFEESGVEENEDRRETIEDLDQDTDDRG